MSYILQVVVFDYLITDYSSLSFTLLYVQQHGEPVIMRR